MKTWHVYLGKVTDAEAHDGGKLGDDEWQFSDAPEDRRSYSEDFLTIAAGLAALAPAIFIFYEAVEAAK